MPGDVSTGMLNVVNADTLATMVWSLLDPAGLFALTAMAGLLAMLFVRLAAGRAARSTHTGTGPTSLVKPVSYGLVPVVQLSPDAPGRPRSRAPSAR
jgi:hypothetical protein